MTDSYSCQNADCDADDSNFVIHDEAPTTNDRLESRTMMNCAF